MRGVGKYQTGEEMRIDRLAMTRLQSIDCNSRAVCVCLRMCVRQKIALTGISEWGVSA